MHRFLLALTLVAMPLLSQAIEEPDHEVTRRFDNVELRRYAPYVVAEVTFVQVLMDRERTDWLSFKMLQERQVWNPCV